jgi:putative intracellular protease/amidase
MARVLMPLPDRDFDVTEVSVPWRLIKDAGHEVVFATENGEKAAADPLLLTGVIFGQLGAEPMPKQYYHELEDSPEFNRPIKWGDIDSRYEAFLLPGGHAPGMRQYLGSELLQAKLRNFAAKKKPLAAICHGVLVLARAGVLQGKKTTCLPKYMERIAYFLTAWKLGKYYRTYDAYVEDEVRASGAEFIRGPIHLMSRGTRDNDAPAFCVEDDNYISARWPGDAYLFARKLIQHL